MIVYPEAAAVAAGGEHADTDGVRESGNMRPKRICVFWSLSITAPEWKRYRCPRCARLLGV